MKRSKMISLAMAIVLCLCTASATRAEPVDSPVPVATFTATLPAMEASAAEAMTTDVPAETVPPTGPAAPTDTPSPEPTPEATPEAMTTEAPAAVNGSVSIALVAPETLHMGDTVALVATLQGYDGVNVQLQWQCSRDGIDWTDVHGANGLRYQFTLDQQSAGTSWRLAVTVL